jgi:hypothetical protein
LSVGKAAQPLDIFITPGLLPFDILVFFVHGFVSVAGIPIAGKILDAL